MKKAVSDILLKQVTPPDYKKNLSSKELSEVIVTRLGLKRKASRADHAKLLLELLSYKKENIPLPIEQMAKIMGVSNSQAYEELRKWRTMGLIEFVKLPNKTGTDTNKGYILAAPTVNRMMDRLDSSLNAFMRETRRISKDFDDLFMLEFVRKEKGTAEPPKAAESTTQTEEISETESAETTEGASEEDLEASESPSENEQETA